ncbi:hypothetical protein D1872_269390 [compost metagenome]
MQVQLYPKNIARSCLILLILHILEPLQLAFIIGRNYLRQALQPRYDLILVLQLLVIEEWQAYRIPVIHSRNIAY